MNQGCGLDTCSSDERYQTRSCDPAGCNVTSQCVYDVLCLETCSDGTPYGECNLNGYYCDNGSLIPACGSPHNCGCPSGKSCNETSEECYTLPEEYKTFGKTDVGGASTNIYHRNIAGCNFTLPEDGTVTKISVYLTNAGSDSYDFSVLIYNSTLNYIARSDQTLSLPLNGWYNFTLSQPLEAGNYNLAFWTSEGSDITTLYYDTGSTGQWGVRYQYYNGPPDPVSWQIGNNYNMSIYAEYITT